MSGAWLNQITKVRKNANQARCSVRIFPSRRFSRENARVGIGGSRVAGWRVGSVAVDALEAHRAMLVGGLARVRVERRVGEAVGRCVVHRDEDLSLANRLAE